MRRWLYLSTLPCLQLALVFKLAPPLAQAFSVEAAAGHAPAGWPVMLQLAATAAAIVGATLALVFPALALSRHRRSGPLRFYGMPGWGVALALGGCAMLVAGSLLVAITPRFPADAAMTSALVAQPMIAGGIALAAAGVLCAEILHRSVVPGRATANAERGSGRIEVAQPADLRTRAI